MACTYAAGGGECDPWGFNRSAPSVQRDGRIERMAEAMKLPGPDAVGPAIREMNRRLGLPAGLSEIGVSESVFPKIIAGALADHTHKTNPREATVEDYRELLASSM